MSLSPIAVQTSILQEALEEQQKYLRKRPLISIDERCCHEMKKLQQLICEGSEGSLNRGELSQVYTILIASEKSFEAGLQRIMGETFGSMFVDTHNGHPPWEVAMTSRDDIFRACLPAILYDWVVSIVEWENRLQAKNEILDFLENKEKTELNLSSFELKNLPDIFHGEIVKRLTYLDICRNRFIMLPESIKNLVELKRLNVSDNKVAILPEWIESLIELEELNVSGNFLKAIPETVKCLTKLKKLDVSDNEVAILPEWMGDFIELEELELSLNDIIILPEWIGNLRKLKKIYVNRNECLTMLPESIGNLSDLEDLQVLDNRLRLLPESMGNLHNLKGLDVGGNQLESMPEWIGNLSELEYLSFDGNKIVTLPESIGNLRKLKKLDLERNPSLASLPNTVLQLPNTCDINIENCGFSLRFLENLQAIVNVPGYSGPRIFFSIHRESGYRTKTLKDSLQDLCEIGKRTTTFFSNAVQDESKRSLLEMWLNRICEIADYKSSNERKEQIANQVLDYLEETATNEEFREIFYSVIADATRTCGDRVALSMLHIGLAYDESKIDLRDTQTLAKFLIRGVFVMSILEDVAREKIPTLGLVDEIEVYLGYPILLKERLQIPINIGQMLYARCSGITAEDLNSAETYVKEQIENKDTICSFLCDQAKWLKALEARFPEEITKLKEQRMTRLEEDLSQANTIQEDYKKGLTRLTNELINWESLS